ncbi:hypothetical protein Focb16_v014865 [Fusarium oxysporum f. sp. cubense]|uniref:Uncharacterized protein n=1 Tax=Fusarium oxysporum f. sp. cubense TaxID=61366 RepID=A0A559KUU0_FUSOC|nr:hypothetical protein Focb16_v014865 [Fusarium oxysporum f. sp. cubense]
MASQSHQEPDPLDVLQNMVNDVLVHTGKALRASRKDAQGSTQSTQSTLKSKLPESIDGFREALHKLEWDIIDAKSVLMRDIKRLQEQKQQQSQQIQQSQPTPVSQPPRPQPVESQSNSPMVIDLESSPPPPPQDQHMTEIKTNKPVAPFPDMGMGLPDVGQPISVPNDETSSSVIPSTGPEQPITKTISPAAPASAPAATAPMAPMPIMEQKPVDNQNNDVTDLTGDGPHSELNFTNMQFTLAPTNNDSQNPSNSQDPSFDLATFAPPEGNDDILGLDDILPTNTSSQTNGISQLPAGSADNASKQDLPMDTDNLGASQEMSTNNYDSVFDDEIFGGLGTGDGLADGTDDITFESLMNDRDDDNLNYGEFDDTFLLENI